MSGTDLPIRIRGGTSGELHYIDQDGDFVSLIRRDAEDLFIFSEDVVCREVG